MNLLQSMVSNWVLCLALSRYLIVLCVAKLLHDTFNSPWLCSFHLFWQAAVSALQNQPIVNAVIDGDDIIYRDYVDVSVAVGTSKVGYTPYSR